MAEVVVPKNYLSRKPSLDSTEVAGVTGVEGFADLYFVFLGSMFCIDTFYTIVDNLGYPAVVKTRDQNNGFFVQVVGKPSGDPNLVCVLSAANMPLLKSSSVLYSPDPENVAFSWWCRIRSFWPPLTEKDLYLNHESPADLKLDIYTRSEWKIKQNG